MLFKILGQYCVVRDISIVYCSSLTRNQYSAHKRGCHQCFSITAKKVLQQLLASLTALHLQNVSDSRPVPADTEVPRATEVAVIGGGIIGVCASLKLAEQGIPVTFWRKGKLLLSNLQGTGAGAVNKGVTPGRCR
ncbi:MAG: hypothetical protein CM1200mP41_21980 [Gammaproteobacteria bacterium]|nr:MAG: hypothetical protein CM1200mP41_21980 [Gammaproteobacteria bacterium]